MAVVEHTEAGMWTWKSWIDSSNTPETDFPLQNLPYGIFCEADGNPRMGIAIGEFVLDLQRCNRTGLLEGLSENVRAACEQPSLNGLIACGASGWSSLRRRLAELLRTEADPAHRRKTETALLPLASVTLLKPVQVGNYTDFYASIHHATNVGRLFRPDQPLLPNYKFVPIGYHGRASSLVVSGTDITRPCGQTKAPSSDLPKFGPSTALDYELEVGAYIGKGNPLGEQVSLEHAEVHLFGISLVNDWSARDIQTWEYQPLGPFLSKSFATSISPWVVSMDALAPFRVAMPGRPVGDPAPLPYLSSVANQNTGAIDMRLEVLLSSASMRSTGNAPMLLSSGNLRDLYWSFAQLVTHHTSNGCNLLSGDLLASGTVSGAEEGTQGSLLEMTRYGTQPINLPSGELRSFLEDGDEIILRGYCQKKGFPRIGLGECRGRIMPAPSRSS